MTQFKIRSALGLALAAWICPEATWAQPFQAQPPHSLESLPSVPPIPAPPSVAVPPLAPPQARPVSLSPAQPRPPVQYTPHLAWEADLKAYRANAGETSAHFTFGLTNISSIEVVVNRVTTSCGCTVARLPAQPWRLTPGASGQIDVTVDLRGKWGVLQKFITVDTSDGFKPLRVQVTIPTSTVQPPMVMANRAQNMELARADRQAVFKNDCARCHLQPTVGKVGAALYQAACAICHDSAHRATMVPDLHALTHATDREFWKTWVTSGKAGTLMPAFAMREGGPLTDAQVDSLVNYLAGAFPQRITIIPNRPPPLPPPLPPGPPQAAQ